MKNASVFQIVILCVFGLFLMGGIAVVAVYSSKSKSSQTNAVPIKIWGTYNAQYVNPVIEEFMGNSKLARVSYSQKSPDTFDADLSEAIAVGNGPDVVLLRQDSLVANLSKLSPILYDSYSVRDFKDDFLEVGEPFLAAEGVYAVPFVVDPLVMYWNRDIFSRSGLVNPPAFWDEVYSLANQLTKKTEGGSITQSAIALGTYDNVSSGKEILALLFLQSGNSIVSWDSSKTRVEVTLTKSPSAPENVLSFYTQFADPRKGVVSWSRALPDSESMFLSNRLAVYLGFSSEAKGLRAKSPNLNFDVAEVPQSRSRREEITFGRAYGFGILKSSVNPTIAFTVIQKLTSADAIELLSETSGLPPVRRDVKLSNVDNPFYPVFVQASLVSRFWLDPKKSTSDIIFRDMVESALSGFVSPTEAISTAEIALNRALPRK